MALFEGALHEFAAEATIAGAITPDALYQLGLQYCLGRDGAPDFIAAHKWFNLAATRGSVEARRMRSEISADMSREEIAAAQREAREWLRLH